MSLSIRCSVLQWASQTPKFQVCRHQGPSNTTWTMKACLPSHRGQAVRNIAILCDSVLAPQEPPPFLHKVIAAPVRQLDLVHSRSFRPVPKSPGTTAGLQSDRLPTEIQHESRGPRQRRPRGTGRAGSQDEARDALGG